jgi:hypothetical protein
VNEDGFISDDELYRQATGQYPAFTAQPDDGEFMDEDEVLGRVSELAGRGAVSTFPLRIQPDGPHPGDKVFRVPVPCDDGRYIAAAFSFGYESDDEMESWKPRWRAVDGPMTMAELTELGKS